MGEYERIAHRRRKPHARLCPPPPPIPTVHAWCLRPRAIVAEEAFVCLLILKWTDRFPQECFRRSLPKEHSTLRSTRFSLPEVVLTRTSDCSSTAATPLSTLRATTSAFPFSPLIFIFFLLPSLLLPCLPTPAENRCIDVRTWPIKKKKRARPALTPTPFPAFFFLPCPTLPKPLRSKTPRSRPLSQQPTPGPRGDQHERR